MADEASILSAYGAAPDEGGILAAYGAKPASAEPAPPPIPKPTLPGRLGSPRNVPSFNQPSIGARALANAPESALSTLERLGQVAGTQPRVDQNGPKRTLRSPFTGKSVEVNRLPDVQDQSMGELSGIASGISNAVMHPQETFADNPVGSTLGAAAALRGGYKAATSDAARKAATVAGAGLKAAPGSVAENLDIVHPLRVIPRVARDVYKAGKEAAGTADIPVLKSPRPISGNPTTPNQPGPLKPPLASPEKAPPGPGISAQAKPAEYGHTGMEITPQKPPPPLTSPTKPRMIGNRPMTADEIAFEDAGKDYPPPLQPPQPNPIQDALGKAMKTVDQKPQSQLTAPSPSHPQPVLDKAAEWLANKQAKDNALADWAIKKGITPDLIQEGEPFANMVKSANGDLGKSYRADITRADHAQRVQELRDLMKQKLERQGLETQQ